MNLLTDYTQFHGAKPYFTTFYIQLCSCRMSSIIQNCLCGYNLAIGAALPYKHTTCIPRRNDANSESHVEFQREIHVVCLQGGGDDDYAVGERFDHLTNY